MVSDKKLIPKGIYCYNEHGVCPYWGLRLDKPEQDNGYCKYLEFGDWETTRLSLLWDQVKECGVNEYDE